MNRCKIALAGVGGFGDAHVMVTEALVEEGLAQLVAFAEPRDAPPAVAKLQSMGARRYVDYDEMLAQETDLDVVCLATPIPCHYPMAMAALQRGLHVFLEKPPAVRIQDMRAMIALQEQKGVFCTVGFQDIARPTVLTLKRRLCEGALGRIHSIRAEARWLRTHAYFTRSNWTGKTRVGDGYVLDGPMNNACSHVLNLVCFLAGPELHEFARPRWVQAELYHANPFEGEDTDCLRAELDTGVDACIHLTLCSATSHPRSWVITGEKGEARLHDLEGVDLPGEHIAPVEHEHPSTPLLRRLIEVIQGSDEPLLMPLAEAEGHTLLTNGAYESAGTIHAIPAKYQRQIAHDDSVATVVDGIDATIVEAARSGKLLSEVGVPWAVPTERFSLEDYTGFPVRWNG